MPLEGPISPKSYVNPLVDGPVPDGTEAIEGEIFTCINSGRMWVMGYQDGNPFPKAIVPQHVFKNPSTNSVSTAGLRGSTVNSGASETAAVELYGPVKFSSLPSTSVLSTDASGRIVAGTGSAVVDGDKGDITVSSSGATWTIDNAAVTYAKIQDVTGLRLLGRGASTVGSVQEITVGNGLKLSGGSLSVSGASPSTNLVDELRTISTGLGLTGGGNLSTDRTFTVDFAASGVSSSTKAVRADDSRLSNARTPTAHVHQLIDVSDIQITSLNDKNLLQYSSATSKWINVEQDDVVDGGNF